MKTQEYIALVNKVRTQNKGKWNSFTEKVNGVSVGIKFYDTWIQRLEIADAQTIYMYDTPMDCKVSKFKEVLNKAMNDIETKMK